MAIQVAVGHGWLGVAVPGLRPWLYPSSCWIWVAIDRCPYTCGKAVAIQVVVGHGWLGVPIPGLRPWLSK